MYYLHIEKNAITGSGFSPDDTLPSGCAVCTKEQAQKTFLWEIVDNRIIKKDIAKLNGFAKTDKLKEINSKSNYQMSLVTANTPKCELDSWTKQEDEARAYAANSTRATPLLSALATARGMQIDVLAGKIIAKADYFASISGRIIGKRQALIDQLNSIDLSAANAAGKINAIIWTD